MSIRYMMIGKIEEEVKGQFDRCSRYGCLFYRKPTGEKLTKRDKKYLKRAEENNLVEYDSLRGVV